MRLWCGFHSSQRWGGWIFCLPPLSSYLALAFLVLVVGLMAYFEDTRVALYIGPAFLVLLTVLYYALRLTPKEAQGTASAAS